MIALRGSQLANYFTPFRTFGGKEQWVLDLWLKHYEDLGIRTKVVIKKGEKVLLVNSDDHLQELNRELVL
jgi:hypothetical protein